MIAIYNVGEYHDSPYKMVEIKISDSQLAKDLHKRSVTFYKDGYTNHITFFNGTVEQYNDSNS